MVLNLQPLIGKTADAVGLWTASVVYDAKESTRRLSAACYKVSTVITSSIALQMPIAGQLHSFHRSRKKVVC